jgi:hypothetical protein
MYVVMEKNIKQPFIMASPPKVPLETVESVHPEQVVLMGSEAAPRKRESVQAAAIDEIKQDIVDGDVDPRRISMVSAVIVEVRRQQDKRDKVLIPAHFKNAVRNVVNAVVGWYKLRDKTYVVPSWVTHVDDILQLFGRTSAKRVDVIRGSKSCEIQDDDTAVAAITRAMITAALRGKVDLDVGSGSNKKSVARTLLIAAPLSEDVKAHAINMVDAGIMEEVVDIAHGRTAAAPILEEQFKNIAAHAVSTGLRHLLKTRCWGLCGAGKKS